MKAGMVAIESRMLKFSGTSVVGTLIGCGERENLEVRTSLRGLARPGGPSLGAVLVIPAAHRPHLTGPFHLDSDVPREGRWTGLQSERPNHCSPKLGVASDSRR